MTCTTQTIKSRSDQVVSREQTIFEESCMAVGTAAANPSVWAAATRQRGTDNIDVCVPCATVQSLSSAHHEMRNDAQTGLLAKAARENLSPVIHRGAGKCRYHMQVHSDLWWQGGGGSWWGSTVV